MIGKTKKGLALGLAVILATASLTGCGDSPSNQNTATPTASSSPGASATPDAKPYNELAMEVNDTSDLPDWTGKKLTLRYWAGHGTGGFKKFTPMANDVVTPEIERVTGVHIDEDNSFDNGSGQTFAQKLALVVAANDFPEIANNVGDLKTLVERDLVYDLTDLIPQYAPNIMKKLPQSLKGVWVTDNRVNYNGRIYAISSGLSEGSLVEVDPTLDTEKYSRFFAPREGYYSFAIRDDIVKKLFPEAKTQAEIETLFEQNGTFTKDEILDIPLNSKEDFFKMLYDIKALGIKEGNQEVFPFYLNQGGDNWHLLTGIAPALYGIPVTGNTSQPYNYFAYYDKLSKSFNYTYKTPEFKAMIKDFAKLTQDGIASPEAFIDTPQIITEKINNGLFAVVYPYGSTVLNANAQLEKSGKDYRYRRVYVNIQPDTAKYPVIQSPAGQTNGIVIFKSQVKEEDLPQILRYIDYMVSDAGEKLLAWGPASAGLFEEKDGQRSFKDKELEDYMVYNVASDKALSYNLANGLAATGTLPNGGFYPSYVRNFYSKFAPAVTYDLARTAADANTYFKIGFVETVSYKTSLGPTIYGENATVPEADTAWKARPSFEDALERVLASQSDAQFEQTFNEFLANAEKIGYNEELIGKIWDAFKVKNADYMDALEK